MEIKQITLSKTLLLTKLFNELFNLIGQKPEEFITQKSEVDKKIEVIKILMENNIHIDTAMCDAVDFSNPNLVLAFLKEQGLSIENILKSAHILENNLSFYQILIKAINILSSDIDIDESGKIIHGPIGKKFYLIISTFTELSIEELDNLYIDEQIDLLIKIYEKIASTKLSLFLPLPQITTNVEMTKTSE